MTTAASDPATPGSLDPRRAGRRGGHTLDFGAMRREDTMSALGWIGAALLVLWAVLWLGFKIVSGVVHLLVIAGIVLLVWGLVKRGTRAVGTRT